MARNTFNERTSYVSSFDSVEVTFEQVVKALSGEGLVQALLQYPLEPRFAHNSLAHSRTLFNYPTFNLIMLRCNEIRSVLSISLEHMVIFE